MSVGGVSESRGGADRSSTDRARDTDRSRETKSVAEATGRADERADEPGVAERSAAEPAKSRASVERARDAQLAVAAEVERARAPIEAQLPGAEVHLAQATGPGPVAADPAPGARPDNVTRQIMASVLEERHGVPMGGSPAESAALAQADIVDVLNAPRVSPRAVGVLEDMMGLYSVSAPNFEGFDFLDDRQRARASELLGQDFEAIESHFVDRSRAADRLETMPALAEAAAMSFYGGGPEALREHYNLIDNLADNFQTGQSFQSTNEIGKLNDLFQHLQASGNVEGYQAMVAAMGYYSTDEQQANIESSINAAAVFNTANLTGQLVDILGSARALRMTGGSMPRMRNIPAASLALSLRQQAGITQLAQTARADILADFRLLDNYLSSRQLAFMRTDEGRAVFRANIGHAIEQRVAAMMRRDVDTNPDSLYRGVEWTGVSNSPYDFRTADGVRFDLTAGSPGSILSHARRDDVDFVITYDTIPMSAYRDFRRVYP